MDGLEFNKIGFDQKDNLWLLVWSEGSWVQTCKTGDQSYYSDTSTNDKCSLAKVFNETDFSRLPSDVLVRQAWRTGGYIIIVTFLQYVHHTIQVSSFCDFPSNDFSNANDRAWAKRSGWDSLLFMTSCFETSSKRLVQLGHLRNACYGSNRSIRRPRPANSEQI